MTTAKIRSNNKIFKKLQKVSIYEVSKLVYIGGKRNVKSKFFQRRRYADLLYDEITTSFETENEDFKIIKSINNQSPLYSKCVVYKNGNTSVTFSVMERTMLD